jgi:hypothetical protein
MQVITRRTAVKIPIALLLACAVLSADAAEQQPVRAGSDITHNSSAAGPQSRQKWQFCLIDSRNCLSLDRRAPRPCLVTAPLCDGDRARIEPLGLAGTR